MPQAESVAATCAVHEGAQSIATCARCGNFVCPLCLDDQSGLPDHCGPCRVRAGGGKIVWERGEGNWLGRWWRTTREVLLQPTNTIERSRPGSLGAAIGYALLTASLIGTALGALGACTLGTLGLLGVFDDALADAGGYFQRYFFITLFAMILIYPIFVVLGIILSVAFRTTAFHLTAMLVGGRGSYGDSLWSACYLHAIMLTVLPMVVLQQIPLVGAAITLLGWLLVETWIALQLTTVARRYHGLADGRAAIAGWAGFIAVVLLFTSCCLFFMMVGFMEASRMM